MYPAQFDYRRAESVEHALDLLEDNPDAELLAGGHSLLPMMKSGLAAPPVLVDIGGLDDLGGIDADDGTCRIGALTRYADVAASADVWRRATVVAEAARAVGDIQVRNRGTVGGNVAHADPASDLPAAVVAADATLRAIGPGGERRIEADDFFTAMYTTALGEGEVLAGIDVPVHDDRTGGAYEKAPSPSSGYALVGVAAAVEVESGRIETARVAANGVMDHPVRLTAVEDALVGAAADDPALGAAAGRAPEPLDEVMMMDDVQASAEYRTQLLREYTRRALATAVERAGAEVTPP